MKSRTRFIAVSLVASAMLPLAAPVAGAATFGSLLGQQAKALGQQAKGAASGVGTVDLTDPKDIPGQLKSNAQTAVTQVQSQAEQTGLGDAQGVLGVLQGKLGQLQSQIPQN